MTTYNKPQATFSYEYGFTSKDGAIPLFYCDDSTRITENMNTVVSDFEHDELSDEVFYQKFLDFLVNHDKAPIFEESDDLASYIFCMPEVLNNDEVWKSWLLEFGQST